MRGETLRGQRLQRGLALDEAAAELGIPAKSLRALEWDRRDLVGSADEAERLERRYAAFLGLEAHPPAAQATAAPPAPAPPAPAPPAPEPTTASPAPGQTAAPPAPAPTAAPPAPAPPTPATAAPPTPAPPAPEPAAAPPAPAATAAPPTPAPPAPRRERRAVWVPLLAVLAPLLVIALAFVLGEVVGGAGDGESAREPSPRPRASSTASTPDGRLSPPSTAASTAAPRKRPVNLVLTAALGDSWVEAHSESAAGPLLFEGTLASGRELRLAADRIWLRLGAASNLSFSVNGRPVPADLHGTLDAVVTPQGIQPAEP